MTVEWQSWSRRIAAECLVGGAALAVLIFTGLQLGFGLAAAGFICLTALVLIALRVGFASTLILTAAAVVALPYFFSRPIVFTLGNRLARDATLMIALPVATLMVSWLTRDLRQRRAKLSESEHHWREVFEQNPTLYFLVDAHRSIMSANAIAVAQLGYSAEEFVGRSFLDISADEDRALVESHLALCVENPGKPHAWEARKVRKDGEIIWAHENARFVQWDANEPVFLISCEDITERRQARRQAEETINRSQAYLHEAQRMGRMGSWSRTVSSGVFSASPEWFRMFGIDPDRPELADDLVHARVHPDDRAFFDEVRRTRSSSNADFDYDFRIVLPGGEVRHIHGLSHAIVGKDGAVVDTIGTNMDVTERVEAEQAVRRSEASLHEAQRLGRMGSWTHDLATRRTSVTPELYRIFGHDPESGPLTRRLMGRAIHPDDRAVVVQKIEHGRQTGTDVEVDHRIVAPDGAIKHVHSVSHPQVSDAGELAGYTGVIMDVTELRQAEEALRQAYADLARVSRITIMGELTASLAHEINQPIAAAVANANACLRWLAAETPDLDEARAAVEAILSNSGRAAEIIGRTRRLFEKGAAQRELTEVDEVVRETVLLLSGEASRHSVSIRSFLAATEIMADRVQLQQVVMNLILNGIDATREVDGPREIAIRSRIADDGEIMVSVSDTGVGFRGDQADRLFETFFTTKPHGTGMGLSISRSIIAAHGGRLWAEPNQPRGAVFRFTLPIAPSPATV